LVRIPNVSENLVIFTPLPLFLLAKLSRYPSGWFQSQFGMYGEEGNLLFLSGIKLGYLGHSARGLVAMYTELSWLPAIY
jgi:hypothetical protein